MASQLVHQLRELASLHAAGVLNDAEFTAAKERLLGHRHGAGPDRGSGSRNSAPPTESSPRDNKSSQEAELSLRLPPKPPPSQDGSGLPLEPQSQAERPSAPQERPPNSSTDTSPLGRDGTMHSNPVKPPAPRDPSPDTAVQAQAKRALRYALVAAAALAILVIGAVLSGLGDSGGAASASRTHSRVESLGLTAWVEPGGCNVNQIYVENRSSRVRVLETRVAFYDGDEQVESFGPFAWHVGAGESGTLHFMLPSDTWNDYSVEELIRMDCRLLSSSIE